MTNTIDELMFRIEDVLATPWPQVSIADKESLIDYYRNWRASVSGGMAPKMKKHEEAPKIKAKLVALGISKPKDSGLRRL